MMKRILVALMFVGTFAQAQQEVKFDVSDALIMKSLEVSYEFYLNDETSVGASLLHSFSKDDVKFRYNEKTMLTPYFRYYLPITPTKLSDFKVFGEVFLGINSGRKKHKETKKVVGATDKVVEVEETVYRKYTDGALGIGGGLKYVSPQNFVFEAHAGVGRNLFNDKAIAIVPRVGICIGYRF
ncbi:MAG: DUF3575 domain-containing protein [Flavobacteriaceae bacterium]|nr:DUF3575 domain-containing protein [Flavobacteriaceae bacterium]MBS9768009.1 DUF3575 domain-containing protein [Flavobacteriaceae bacterium]